jgi:hypothetical protein
MVLVLFKVFSMFVQLKLFLFYYLLFLCPRSRVCSLYLNMCFDIVFSVFNEIRGNINSCLYIVLHIVIYYLSNIRYMSAIMNFVPAINEHQDH